MTYSTNHSMCFSLLFFSTHTHTPDHACGFEDERICGFSQDRSDVFDWTRQNHLSRNPKRSANTGPETDRSGTKEGKQRQESLYVQVYSVCIIQTQYCAMQILKADQVLRKDCWSVCTTCWSPYNSHREKMWKYRAMWILYLTLWPLFFMSIQITQNPLQISFFTHTYSTRKHTHTLVSLVPGYYMYIEASKPRVQGDKALLLSPLFNVTTVRGPKGAGRVPYCISFYYHMKGKHIGK